MTVAHFHDDYENYLEYKDDPYHSKKLVESVIFNILKAETEDHRKLLRVAEPGYILERYGGGDAERRCLEQTSQATTLSIRQCAHSSCSGPYLIRNFGRNRKMEVEAVFPAITIPDTFGEVATWEEFNDLVDIYYDALGWDRETGGLAHTRNIRKIWPFRHCRRAGGTGKAAKLSAALKHCKHKIKYKGE